MRGRKVCDVFLYYAMARSLMCKSVCDKKSREEEDLTDKKVSGHSFSSIEDHGFWGKHFLESVLKEFCFSWQYVFVIIFMYHSSCFRPIFVNDSNKPHYVSGKSPVESSQKE